MLEHFLLDPQLTHFNNGSFGTVPKVVRESRIHWLDLFETHPDLHLKANLLSEINHALDPIAAYLGTTKDNINFVHNATQGINIVLRRHTLFLSTVYAGVKVLIDFLHEKNKVELLCVEHLLGPDELLLEAVQKAIKALEKEGKQIKVAVIDAISSVPGLILPYNDLAKILKAHGALVLIDGAHAFGQIPLNLNETHADYVVTNLHKWGYAYRPCAILYAKKERQNALYPTIITYGYGSNNFKETFAWPGTIDFTCWLSSPAALNFRLGLGDAEMRNYMHELAWQGGQKIASALKTEVLGLKHQTGFMVNVAFPFVLRPGIDAKFENLMWEQFKFRVKVFMYNHRTWIRVSAQIFLEMEDFDRLAQALVTALPSILHMNPSL
ncbi:hypothetical protein DSO57_1030583 [Entomophthora muscae]|uniref:Uncharacterized protein n=1 Tax=Entomophthora muscae TaxID=34485 RepID=A0ACC2S362_9FUNG|nr:hypothetical protein DSO57_1030583 [Entomophthora muscae]